MCFLYFIFDLYILSLIFNILYCYYIPIVTVSIHSLQLRNMVTDQDTYRLAPR